MFHHKSLTLINLITMQNEMIGEFRVIDIYRREGDKLKENWIFIDLLHFFKQQGVDILNKL